MQKQKGESDEISLDLQRGQNYLQLPFTTTLHWHTITLQLKDGEEAFRVTDGIVGLVKLAVVYRVVRLREDSLQQPRPNPAVQQ
jgi:hypothetical protein